MQRDEVIEVLKGYQTELDGMLSRFTKDRNGLYMAHADEGRYRELVLELRDIFDDTFADGSRHTDQLKLPKPPTGVIRKAERSFDIKKDFSQEQLAGIGAVIVAFTETEYRLKAVLYNGLGVTREIGEVLTARLDHERLSELVKLTMSEFFRLDSDTRDLFSRSLGGFMECKRHRDNLAHGHIVKAKLGLGLRIKYTGTVLNVDMSQKAVDGIYDRLVLIRQEFEELAIVFQLMGVRIRIDPAFLGDLRTGPSEQPLRERIEKVRDCQRHRYALPALPELPGEPPTAQGKGDGATTPKPV